jgi:hypothetical protein
MERWFAAKKTYPDLTAATFETAAKAPTVAAPNAVDVTIEMTGATACATGGAAAGGGLVTSSPSGKTFTISPYSYDCTKALGDSYTEPK